PHFLDLATAAQLLGYGEEIHGLVALEEADHGVEDLPMALLVEVGRFQELDRLGQTLPLEQDRPQHGTLCLQTVRGNLGGEQVVERRHVSPRSPSEKRSG